MISLLCFVRLEKDGWAVSYFSKTNTFSKILVSSCSTFMFGLLFFFSWEFYSFSFVSLSFSNETNRKLAARLKIQNKIDEFLLPHISFLTSTEGKLFTTGIFVIRTCRILFCEVISCSVKSCCGKCEPGERGEQKSHGYRYAKSILLTNWVSFITAAPSVFCAGTCFQPPQI